VNDSSQVTEEPKVVVRDRRRIDPETGQVRTPAAGEEPAAGPPPGAGKHAAPEPDDVGAAVDIAADGDLAQVQQELEERTSDLKRLTAEYANYRKRVDRDRELVAANAKAQLASDMLPLLDDIERAEAHGDLNGAFRSVAEKLVGSLNKAGLEAFGHEGEEFDPSVHEAVQHSTSPDVQGPTVTAVLRRGYRFGDRVVRAALVAVTDHEPGPAAPEVPVAPGIPEPPTSEAPGDTAADERD
jgi:molecular chaperone GrpE